jgi:hypothetical protein
MYTTAAYNRAELFAAALPRVDANDCSIALARLLSAT